VECNVSSIADQVADMHGSMPADTPFRREQASLAASGLPDGVVTAGTVLPDADLVDALGAATTLYDTVGTGLSVVVLYRGQWCPYCNVTLRTYQEELVPALASRSVPLVAVSPQHPDGSLSMQEKNSLTFPVLSDTGNTLARFLGVLTGPNDEARAAQLSYDIDLTAINADGTVGVPMPTAVILDGNRVVRWIDVHPDYSTRSEAADIIAALDQLKG
jgi:peroxiredoxin